MKTVIMAGGRGTRISSVNSTIPKPLIPIDGIPVLEREIICLRDQGFCDIVLTVAHMAEQIRGYFGDGSRLGVNISYFNEEEPLGNAGALFQIKDELTDEFLLLNADSVFDVDFNRFVEYHHKKGGLVTLFTHPNSHPYDSGLVITDSDSAVIGWLNKEDERPEFYKNRVNAGLHILNKRVLDVTINIPKVDLDRQLLKPLVGTGKMFAYDSPEYVKDMGTPDRYYSICEDYKNGVVQARNLRKKQKAIFLDRDGTINKSVGFLSRIDDFELLPGAAQAIRNINQSEYLCIVATNQPVIARGEATFEQLAAIHNKMETLLGIEGAYIDGLYFCPHHPDGGFAGEIKELKIDCSCRKPKPGMLLEAAKDFGIDLCKSWMVGDGKNDVECGKKAGCKTALIHSQKEGDCGADLQGDSLYELIEKILK